MAVFSRYQSNALLAPYTSWRIGGIAEHLYLPKDIDDLAYFLREIPSASKITLLGLGSNTLIRDKGISGVVLITGMMRDDLSVVSTDDGAIIYATAGVSCPKLARFSVRNELTGLEFLATIPGTLGGALAMNAGCYGSNIWQYVDKVMLLNRQGKFYKLGPADFDITYRFVGNLENQYFVGAYLRLQHGDKATSTKLINNWLSKRQASQPINYRCCGSVFINPEGSFAGYLIEDCGLKGYRLGDASVSKKHANFIINHGRARACDVEYIIQHIIATVAEKHDKILVPEVKIMGDL